jgi:hypothetical protein
LPPGFIETCQPVLYETFPSRPHWSHEIRHDGWRIIVGKGKGRKEGAECTLDCTDTLNSLRPTLSFRRHFETLRMEGI